MSVEIDLAESLAHALEILGAADPQVRPLAGATDVILRLHAGRLKAHRLVSIADVPELCRIAVEPTQLRVGACTPLTELMAHPVFAIEFPGALAAAKLFASPQIRNRATLGGNIGNASPAADMVTPLMACGAQASIASKARGVRTEPVEALFLGFGKTSIAADELVTEVTLPRGPARFQSFAKFGSRGANVIAVINMALCLELDGDQVRSARVAFGSVAPRPHRASKLEAFLHGRTLDERLLSEVRDAVLADISPIDDVRGSKRHKLRLAVNAVEDALEKALEQVRA